MSIICALIGARLMHPADTALRGSRWRSWQVELLEEARHWLADEERSPATGEMLAFNWVGTRGQPRP